MTIAIVKPEHITPDWLTEVLRAGGIEAEVRDFTRTRVGTGQIGQSVRFALEYKDASPGAPKSLVGKFVADEEESRNTGIVLGNYIREVNFYKRLARTALISTPKCYFTDVDPATSEFVLMMEDLAPAEQGDQLKGCTLDQARLAVMEAANLHASHWNDGTLEDLDWVSGTRAAGLRGSADPDAMNALWQGFCARYGDRLGADAKKVGSALVQNYGAYDSHYKGPKSLVHIDYRPDNMMFASAAGGKPLTVLDWQSLAFGCGVTDVAYFLAGALDRDTRKKLEKDLLREYHDRMRTLGVDYDFDSLWRDYRSRAFALYLVAFYASMIVTQTKRGDDMFMQMISSATGQVLDLDALEFLR
jgi:hypothetical protein